MGAGGHASVIADALKLSDREILGFVTPDLKLDTEFCGKTVLGDDLVISNYSPDDIELANGIGALPKKNLRWKLAAIMYKQGYSFTTVIHPNAVIASDVCLDDGVQVMAGAVIQSGTKIGRNTIINTGVLLDHDCSIGMNSHLATGVICSGGVMIGRNTHLGTGTMVIEYTSIGNDCIIAAGSTVYKNIINNIQLIQKKNESTVATQGSSE
jgi:sugar O-acyltransferase (sialic acid O-acetyltransferase NeuD family)